MTDFSDFSDFQQGILDILGYKLRFSSRGISHKKFMSAVLQNELVTLGLLLAKFCVLALKLTSFRWLVFSRGYQSCISLIIDRQRFYIYLLFNENKI